MDLTVGYVALVVDNDNISNKETCRLLHQIGFMVYSAMSSHIALRKAQVLKPDLIILEVSLQEIEGVELCKLMKKYKVLSHSKIVFLTSNTDDTYQVHAFDEGADDYILKPVKPKVLLSRLNALLKRKPFLNGVKSESKQKIVIDADKFLVHIGNTQCELTKKEFEILTFLAENKQTIISREELIESLWGSGLVNVNKRTIDVHVRKLRKKIGEEFILTRKGFGYSFKE
jgi:two-component system alkaline phosphatase synthesis response regulator PhoP